MLRSSDYLAIALGVAGTMITTALGAHVAGFDLPPLATFALLVLAAPIPWLLAVLPQFGVRVPSPPMAAPLPTSIVVNTAAPAVPVSGTAGA